MDQIPTGMGDIVGLLKFGAGFFGEGDSNKEGSRLLHPLLLGVPEAVEGACEVNGFF
jgi:hypothetical protein